MFKTWGQKVQRRLEMRKYEVMYLISPQLSEEELNQLTEDLKKDIESLGGEVQTVDNWGKRTLAYPVKKFNDGYYVVMTFLFPQNQLPEFERRLKLREKVLRYMITLLEKEE
jgi:small subunit ribosomal protein S6